MAEVVAAIGLVSAIAQLVDISVKVVSRLNEFAQRASDVPTSFRSLADRLPLLTQTLRRIQARAQAGDVQEEVAHDLDKLANGLLGQLQFLQQCLDRITPTADASRFERAWKGLGSLSKDEKVRQAVEKIHSGIDVLVLHQTTNNIDISDKILQQLDQLTVRQSTNRQTFGLCLGQAPQIESEAFVGRQAEIAQLHDWLVVKTDAQTQNVVSIVGMGGLGKTQLSLAFARHYSYRFSSVLWFNAKDELSLKQSISAMSTILFRDEQTGATGAVDEDSLIGKMKFWLSEPWNHDWLIILDNYDDPALPNVRSKTGFDIRSYLPSRTQGSVLITTRSPKLTFSKRLILRKLEDVELSIAILSQRSGRDMHTDQDARRLAVRLDGLPLALAISGTYLGQVDTSCAEYLALYDTAWSELHGTDAEQLLEYEGRTLSSTWRMSLDQVRNQDAEAAELLPFFLFFSNRDIWYELVSAGADGGPVWLGNVTKTRVRFDRAMSKLRDYSLIEVVQGSYQLHPCLHDWISERFNTTFSESSFLAALLCVLRNIPNHSSPIYWSQARRLLKHVYWLHRDQFYPLWEMCASNTIVLDARHDFGMIYQDLFELVRAEELFTQALTGYKKVLGNEHPSTLNTLHNLGLLYRKQNKYEASEKMFLQALAGYEKVLGPENPTTIYTFNNLGITYRSQGKYAKAEELFLHALAAFEKIGRDDDPWCLDSVNNLGHLYLTQSKFDEAETLLLRALAGYEKVSGEDHAATFIPVSNLGHVYHAQNRLAEAETMFVRASKGKENTLGRDHPSTLTTVANLGDLYLARDKLADAEETYSWVLSYDRSNDEVVPWQRTCEKYAEVLRRRVREDEGGPSALKHLGRLIEHVDARLKGDKVVLYWLAKLLVQLRDDTNAQHALFYCLKRVDESRSEFEGVHCDRCSAEMSMAGGRHICRKCADVDLCDCCYEKYKVDAVAVEGCSGHDYFDAGKAVSQALTSSQRIGIDEWFRQLKVKYPVPVNE